jgi:RNA-directed DNA polymerase
MEGDIRACFDSLSGTWLQENIPMDKTLLTKWLRAGYIEKEALHPTFDGVPQGGSISPCILVLALSGLEETVKNVASAKDKVNVVSYADDFIITGASKEVLEYKIKPIVETFLKERGLELSPQKTKITHVDEGFDFLGFNVRKYKGKLLIKPSKKNIKSFLEKIRQTIKSNANAKTENLIYQLNPKIRGWTNYFSHVVAKDTFSYIDANIFKAILRWIKRRHPKKNVKWTNKKYFRTEGARKWIFSVRLKDMKRKDNTYYLDLHSAAHTPISRHIKIKSTATPYDPQFTEYFLERQRHRKNIRKTGTKEEASNSRASRSTARITGLA